jgi:hypothetical protein
MDLLKQMELDYIKKKIDVFEFLATNLKIIHQKIEEGEELHSSERGFLESMFIEDNFK